MDAIHYKTRDNHQIITMAAYVALGVNNEWYKEILGIWIDGNESSKLWLGVLNYLKSRGVQKVNLFCIDDCYCFKEAIMAIYPFVNIQRCIIHQIRSSIKFVSYKHTKEFMSDLKGIYTAVNEEIALKKLIILKEK